MKQRLFAVFSTILLTVATATESLAQGVPGCPPEPNRINLRVSVDVKLDPSTRAFRYSYTLHSDRSSEQEIDRFALELTQPVHDVQSPPGWSHGTFHRRPVIGWDAMAVENPDQVRDDASVPPSIVQIKPGASLGGFAFQSPKPPGPVKYFVTGFVPLAAADSELAAEQTVEDCPHLQKHILDQALVGTTVGPIDALPVRIDIKPGSERNPINPKNRGVEPVAVLGAPGFDVNQIDPASVRFGPGQAAPAKGKVHHEDVNGDGLFDALFLFATQSIGLRCHDTALFLTGELRDGRAIVGADAVATAGCR